MPKSDYGNVWRTLAWNRATGEKIEAHGEGDSEFDELVIGNDRDPCWFHLEQMTDNAWWFAVYLSDDERVTGWVTVLHTKPNRLSLTLEGKSPRYWHWDSDAEV